MRGRAVAILEYRKAVLWKQNWTDSVYHTEWTWDQRTEAAREEFWLITEDNVSPSRMDAGPP